MIESRTVEGQAKRQLFARFTINAVPAIAAVGQAADPEGDAASSTPWAYLREDLRGNASPSTGSQVEIVVPLLRDRRGGDR